MPILGGKRQSLLGYFTNTYYIFEKQESRIVSEDSVANESCLGVMKDGSNLKVKHFEVQKNIEILQGDSGLRNNRHSLTKKLFPFNEGFKRLFIVLWFLISILVEISHWKLRGYGIENYAVGLIPFFSLPILYLVFLWVYYGFKK